MKLVLINAQPIDVEDNGSQKKKILCQYKIVDDEGNPRGQCGVQFDETLTDNEIQTLLDAELEKLKVRYAKADEIKQKFGEVCSSEGKDVV